MSEPLTQAWFEERGERMPDHIGDGVYASVDRGHQIWLRTNRGGEIHEIALDHYTMAALIRYKERINGK